MENKRNHFEKDPSLPEFGTKEFNDMCHVYFGGAIPRKSTRELAIEWWNSMGVINQMKLVKEYSKTRPKDLFGIGFTGREIEEIWLKECNRIEDEVFKPNQKQFKDFNPELFKTYIAKFSDEDKLKAKEIIIQLLKK